MNRNDKGLTLFIIEGDEEERKILNLLFQTYPELRLKFEKNIFIYQTHIFNLIDRIKKYYGVKFLHELDNDVDLIKVIRSIPPVKDGARQRLFSESDIDFNSLTKRNFTNIFLIFDFEPHEPNFDPDELKQMQILFSKEEDNGKLYLNYPSVEAFFRWKSGQDLEEFYQDAVEASIYQRGGKFSSHVKGSCYGKRNIIHNLINFDSKFIRIYSKEPFLLEEHGINDLVSELIRIPNWENKANENSIKLLEKTLLKNGISDRKRIMEVGAALFNHFPMNPGETVFEFRRRFLAEMIFHSIVKIKKIIGKPYINVDYDTVDEINDESKLFLEIQLNNWSELKPIYFLSTCLFLIIEQKASLVLNYISSRKLQLM